MIIRSVTLHFHSYILGSKFKSDEDDESRNRIYTEVEIVKIFLFYLLV